MERTENDGDDPTQSLPLPDWAVAEAVRRRDEMLANPELGLTSEEVWKRISDSRPS